MGFKLTILGSNSAIPSFQRHPTSQVLNHNEKLFLIDCGEGTQMQFNKYDIKFHRINHIFISHLHGDHYFGLIGLISTFHLLGRTNPLHIYGQSPLQEVIRMQLSISKTELRFPLSFHEVSASEECIIMEDEELTVATIILNHRIPCTGFIFKEKNRLRKIIIQKTTQYNIPVQAYPDIKKGKDFYTSEGICIKNSELTDDAPVSKSYAYCSDTIYDEAILKHITGVDLLYHEATFMEDLIQRAKETFHTTTTEAASIAMKANVGKLIIGHFSSRYKVLEPLLEESRRIFKNTDLALEGTTFEI
jgi:ribonuclease Z